MMPMIKSPHGEGGCVCAPPATDWTPPPLLPLLNRFDFRSTRPEACAGEAAIMAINSPLNIAAQPGKTRLRKSLKLWQVVMMGLAYLTPMTVFDTFGIVSGISDGHVWRPICWRWRACCLPLSATANWFASFRRPVRPIPTRKSRLIRTSDLWWAGHHCWIISFCR